MGKRLVAAVAALGLGLTGAVIAVPATASASELCDLGISFGQIKLSTGSGADMQICRDWSGTASDPGCRAGAPIGRLRIGHVSTEIFPVSVGGTDGYRIAPGWCATSSGNGATICNGGASTKEVKITDIDHVTIKYFKG